MGILDKRSGGGGADNETAQRPNEQEARHQNLSSRSCARRRRPNSFTLSTPSSCLISSPKPLFALLRSASSPQLVYLIHPIIMPGLLTKTSLRAPALGVVAPTRLPYPPHHHAWSPH